MKPRQKPSIASTSGASHMLQRNGSSGGGGRAQKYTQLDFGALNIHVLRKYRQVFGLNIKARSSKDDLVVAATRHFSNHTVDEVDTIARFLYTVHSNKGRIHYGFDGRWTRK
ncbi:hypothetical protein GGI15_004447 [Coemansia interrupta]|uniref:Histone deacetylase complex subunit SAP30 Sin3 binding domain-containing protein n=1 Tax=Coemansia interrupta TaxID=1126814 RepID=A0A9W8H3T1_9FUNG|nr:hypothetical protein GGI15_004447 [Coemansia interrupta]